MSHSVADNPDFDPTPWFVHIFDVESQRLAPWEVRHQSAAPNPSNPTQQGAILATHPPTLGASCKGTTPVNAQPSTASALDLQSHSADPDLSDAGGARRHFRFSVDIQSFRASVKIPVSCARVFVTATMPSELNAVLWGACGPPANASSSLVSSTPIDVQRGGDAALRGGCVIVEFDAGVMELARALALQPIMHINVWHRWAGLKQNVLVLASKADHVSPSNPHGLSTRKKTRI